MQRGTNSLDELRNRIIERARQTPLRLGLRTRRLERSLLGWDGYHHPDVCELGLLSELEA